MCINHSFLPQAQHKKLRFIHLTLGVMPDQASPLLQNINKNLLMLPI